MSIAKPYYHYINGGLCRLQSHEREPETRTGRDYESEGPTAAIATARVAYLRWKVQADLYGLPGEDRWSREGSQKGRRWDGCSLHEPAEKSAVNHDPHTTKYVPHPQTTKWLHPQTTKHNISPSIITTLTFFEWPWPFFWNEQRKLQEECLKVNVLYRQAKLKGKTETFDHIPLYLELSPHLMRSKTTIKSDSMRSSSPSIRMMLLLLLIIL